ncbi:MULTISPECIES: hypothetical protein [Ramlibacter]|uniref:Uncharacterized protein n=1 Tax=Ramlibacter pinisoli TaxID=2682844 RepID=A0A6N8IZV5_9BURK|nr:MULTISPECIES: hypothetical protein [Ramlibacter]MBA2962627.1 hypothetical protein [Ramlibacter sp. CGMCC 1.13660]MVQ32569.1 hypothetical protein [Ramlibacter pinisoli]
MSHAFASQADPDHETSTSGQLLPQDWACTGGVAGPVVVLPGPGLAP